MKKTIILMLAMSSAIAVFAKDLKTIKVTTDPVMHCHSCEQKIKGNMRFEKGIKAIETNVEKQEVTLTYDAEKTTPEKLLKGFTKFGYTAKQLTEPVPATSDKENKNDKKQK